MTALDRGDLSSLYEAQERHAPGQLGDNATKEFALRHVFEIAPVLIKQPSDLLRVLLRRHYSGQRIPNVLDERFIQLLRQSTIFNDWPLETLIADRETFFAFLQERWQIFLDREATKDVSPVFGRMPRHPTVWLSRDPRICLLIITKSESTSTTFSSRACCNQSRTTMQTPLTSNWVGIGVRTAAIEDKSRRLGKLIESLQTSIPADDAKHTDWFHFARGWAELVLLVNEQSDTILGETTERTKVLQAQVDAGFIAWICKRYAGLINLPPVPPVMLHHLRGFWPVK